VKSITIRVEEFDRISVAAENQQEETVNKKMNRRGRRKR